jgi:hypothetical protein
VWSGYSADLFDFDDPQPFGSQAIHCYERTFNHRQPPFWPHTEFGHTSMGVDDSVAAFPRHVGRFVLAVNFRIMTVVLLGESLEQCS